MKNTRKHFTASLGAMVLIGSAVFSSAYAATVTRNPLSGDVRVTITAGTDATGAIGLSTGPTGVERPVYYRLDSSDALWIGASNTLPQGCKPTEFKDDDGTAIPILVKLKCNAEDWQGKLSKTGKVFTVKRLP
ncbi:hypothetical protein ACMSI6_03880 [Pseudomonas antarctica]|uniref:hypothetical protein n=1 Tax=Pseudomonas antarctica TaxID=219572 RepID=UPI0039C49605